MLVSEDNRFQLPLMEVEFFNDPRDLRWMIFARALFKDTYNENDISLHTNWLIDNLGFMARLENFSFEIEQERDTELISLHRREPYVIPGRTRKHILMTFSYLWGQENHRVINAAMRTEDGRQSLSRAMVDPQMNPIIETLSERPEGGYLIDFSRLEPSPASEIVEDTEEKVEEKEPKQVNPFSNIDPLAEF